ncbi:hypothetical protein CYMTET_26036, partial [Cymbomonas tetramitiformis]
MLTGRMTGGAGAAVSYFEDGEIKVGRRGNIYLSLYGLDDPEGPLLAATIIVLIFWFGLALAIENMALSVAQEAKSYPPKAEGDMHDDVDQQGESKLTAGVVLDWGDMNDGQQPQTRLVTSSKHISDEDPAGVISDEDPAGVIS